MKIIHDKFGPTNVFGEPRAPSPGLVEEVAPHFDYTEQGRRPTTAQIISAWKKAGKPQHFTVAYGETFAEFEHPNAPPCVTGPGGWCDSGNGCRGVNRDKVIQALAAATSTR